MFQLDVLHLIIIMLNENEVCLNATNYPILNMQDLAVNLYFLVILISWYPLCDLDIVITFAGCCIWSNNNNNNNNRLYWIYMLSLQLIFHMIHLLVIWLVSICS